MRQTAFRILLSAGIAMNIVVLLFRLPLSAMLREIVFQKDERSIFLATGIDKLLSGIAPDGDIFLKFEGFRSEGGHGWGAPEDAASIIYFRAAYFMHPRRVHLGPSEMKIVRGAEFLESTFKPDEKWLMENNVSGILTLSRSPSGEISWDYAETPAREDGR